MNNGNIFSETDNNRTYFSEIEHQVSCRVFRNRCSRNGKVFKKLSMLPQKCKVFWCCKKQQAIKSCFTYSLYVE